MALAEFLLTLESILRGRWLHQFLLDADESTKSFGEQACIERLLERFVDAGTIKAHRVTIIWQQSNQDDLGEIRVLSKILADLKCFELADREVDNHAVWVEALGLDAGFKSTGSDRYLEALFEWKLALQVFDQDLVLSDDQDFGHGLVFKVSKGHSVLLEELDEVIAWNASVLRSGNAIPLESAGVEPFANGSRGHLTDLRDLSCGEHLHIIILRYLLLLGMLNLTAGQQESAQIALLFHQEHTMQRSVLPC